MSQKWILGLIAGALLVAFAMPVAAATSAQAPAQEKLFDFEGDTIETDFLKPDAGMVDTVMRGEHESLITIRADFIDEIVQSAEDI